MNKINNVIIFPTLRRTLEQLEEESFDLIDDQNYELALEKIDELLAHQYTSFDTNVNKLHCLTKLGRLQEAEEFSETLLENENDENYYDYLGYYIMILYEQNNFNALMNTILEEEKKRKIPSPFDRKFRDIYRLCYQMNVMKSNDVTNDLKRAVRDENAEEQLFYVQQWLDLNVEPNEFIINCLKDEKVHPVIKTKLLIAFKERNYSNEMIVEKFGQQVTIQPNELLDITAYPFYRGILNKLAYIEQENPSLHQLIEQLVYQYHYVSFPYFQQDDHITNMAEAFVYVAKQSLSLEVDGHIDEEFIKDVELIQICSQLYLNLMYE